MLRTIYFLIVVTSAVFFCALTCFGVTSILSPDPFYLNN
jgi:hypothetical protein